MSDKPLKLWNGRGFGVLTGKEWRNSSVYVAAYSAADARRVCVEAGGRDPGATEVAKYWSKCWGTPMDGIKPERGLWASRGASDKPQRITLSTDDPFAQKPEESAAVSDKSLPALPEPFDWCYEWDGPYGTRKFSSNSYNGRRPDRSVPIFTEAHMRVYAAAAVAQERERCASKAGEYAQQWWSKHCASNKHMETTRAAHEDFCRLQAAIRATLPRTDQEQA